MKIGIIGMGIVGGTITSWAKIINLNFIAYDKYKEEYQVNFKYFITCDIIFIALPTPFDTKIRQFDLSEMDEILQKLDDINYVGIVVIKSTLIPGTSEKYAKLYGKNLSIIHNPEFLSHDTALDDFINQKQIIIGVTKKCSDRSVFKLCNFYQKYLKNKNFSFCDSEESELIKLSCNSFYAVKIQFFTELYLLCHKIGISYETVRKLMVRNEWIHDIHTHVPGSDGQISFGGNCLPKDILALSSYMFSMGSFNSIMNGCILERSLLRRDHNNINL